MRPKCLVSRRGAEGRRALAMAYLGLISVAATPSCRIVAVAEKCGRHFRG